MIKVNGDDFNFAADGTNDFEADLISAEGLVVNYINETVELVTTNVTVSDLDNTNISIGGADAVAVTLTDPVSGTDDGKKIMFTCSSAHAHTVTCSAAFDGTNKIATFSAVGENIVFVAMRGNWYLVSSMGAVLSAA